MPMPQVVECLDVLSPVLTRMLTPSSETGCFPDNWKQADIHPRLKKPRAEVMFNNLRPINNLSFVSKLVEQAIFSQTLDYLTLYELYPKAQPWYCEFHSTETVVVQFMTSCSLWTSSESLSSYYLTSTCPLWYLGACTLLDQVLLPPQIPIHIFSQQNIEEVWGKVWRSTRILSWSHFICPLCKHAVHDYGMSPTWCPCICWWHTAVNLLQCQL